MSIAFNLASLREIRPHEYGIRFCSGGVITVLTGLIADKYGPAVGGLFLAFPAILPAAASLVQSYQKRRKVEIGCDGSARGKNAAALDMFGATLGSIGLMVFALVTTRLITRVQPAVALLAAAAAWTVAVFTAYWTREQWRKLTH